MITIMKESLKALREKNNYSQATVAKYLGISRQMYIKYESGEAEPPVKVIVALSKLYKVDYAQIIDLMYTILYKIKTLLYCRPNKYKFVISYLLKSFHNLPRVFFPQNIRVFWGIHISSISPSDALLYANSYFKL